MAKVSVIIPVHNTENYLRQCLDSIVNQTHKDLEILCVDDSSTDSSVEILNEYASADDRFKIITLQGKPIGSAAARNHAFDVMTGDYVCFVDSDDWIDLDYIEKMVSAIEKAGTSIVMNRGIIEEIDGKSVKYSFPKDGIYEDNSFIDAKEAINNTFCSIWSKIYKRELFDKYRLRLPEGLPNDDFCFQFISLIHIGKLYIINESAYHYVTRKNSVTDLQKGNKDIDHLRAFDRVFDYYKKNNLLEEGVKIFSIMPFFNVDSEEKYSEYKKYFEKTKDYLFSHKDIYQEIDLFFANNILNTENFEEYVQKFPKSVAISFLRRKR